MRYFIIGYLTQSESKGYNFGELSINTLRFPTKKELHEVIIKACKVEENSQCVVLSVCELSKEDMDVYNSINQTNPLI